MDLNNIFNHINKPEQPLCEREDGTGYFWHKGETVTLQWEIEGDVYNSKTEEYIPSDEFMAGKSVKVKMFNFLGRKIQEWDLSPAPTQTIEIHIDSEFAKELKTGSYTFSVEIYNHMGLVHTLVARDKEFEVK